MKTMPSTATNGRTKDYASISEIVLALVVFSALLLIAAIPAVAQTESVLYNFCSRPSCKDGAGPLSGLIMDKMGNLYGTTNGGGRHGEGTVYKLAPDGTETVLYSFCRKKFVCADGDGPVAGLVMDRKGNLYGTTYYGGVDDFYGTVFKVTPTGTETVLHRFCSWRQCSDGCFPWAGLILDKKGNLYGTTTGGVYSGVVFKLTPGGTETVLGNAYVPMAALVMDKNGNLYGTAQDGGTNYGSVFKVTPSGT